MNFEAWATMTFNTAFLLFALSTAGYLASLLIKRVRLAKLATWVLGTALFF